MNTTKKERFAQLLEIEEIANDPTLSAWISEEIDRLNRPKKPTKKQTENAKIAQELFEAMEVGVEYTWEDLAALVPQLNNASSQKISALIRVNALNLEKIKGAKGKTYYKKAGA